MDSQEVLVRTAASAEVWSVCKDNSNTGDKRHRQWLLSTSDERSRIAGDKWRQVMAAVTH